MDRTTVFPATAAVLAFGSSLAFVASADNVTLQNGDKLNGTIGTVTAKEMKFTSPSLGEIIIPTQNVTSYTFDNPTRVQPRGEPSQTGKVTGDTAGVTIDDKKYDFQSLKSINPPAQEWSGALIANFAVARGNTNRFVVGAEANASLRRDDEANNDRTTFGGGYNFGESGGGASGTPKTTDTDNWNAFGKHDRFWTDQWYGYANLRIEHDRIAQLNYRITPGVGIGYQWIETPKVNFRTEAGLSYIHEEFDPDGSADAIAARLAYRYSNKLSDTVMFFHTLEYLPAFENPGDYILNTDVGLRANLTDNFFSQFKILYKRDSTPAEGSLKNDLLYTIGVGWQF